MTIWAGRQWRRPKPRKSILRRPVLPPFFTANAGAFMSAHYELGVPGRTSPVS